MYLIRHNLIYISQPDTNHLERNISIYAIAYRFKDDSNEIWTKRINAFKDKSPNEINNFSYLFPRMIEDLVKSLPVKPSIIVGAIPSKESILPKVHPIWIIGDKLAKYYGFQNGLNLVSKTVHRPLHILSARGCTGGERDQEVHNKYVSNQINNKENKKLRIFIIDDICTRGSTINEIARAIKNINKCDIEFIGIVLGKTEGKQYYHERRGIDLTNDHILHQFSEQWDLNK